MSFQSGAPVGRPRGFQAWRTPPAFYAGLDAEFHFALDAACTRANCLAPAGLYHDEGRDGLLEEWGRAGEAIYCNPPYGRIRPWIERGVLWGATRTVVMLVPADVSVGWWLGLVAAYAAEVRFVAARLLFLGEDGQVPKRKRGGAGNVAPSAVVIFRLGSAPWSARYSYIGRDGRAL